MKESSGPSIPALAALVVTSALSLTLATGCTPEKDAPSPPQGHGYETVYPWCEDIMSPAAGPTADCVNRITKGKMWEVNQRGVFARPKIKECQGITKVLPCIEPIKPSKRTKINKVILHWDKDNNPLYLEIPTKK